MESDIWFSKTHYMLLNPDKKLNQLQPLSSNNIPIIEKNEIKSLGLTITSTLSWNEDVQKVAHKQIGLFVLCKYKYILIMSSLLFKTMIRLILEFGDIIYNNSARCVQNIQST